METKNRFARADPLLPAVFHADCAEAHRYLKRVAQLHAYDRELMETSGRALTESRELIRLVDKLLAR